MEKPNNTHSSQRLNQIDLNGVINSISTL